MIAQQPKAIKFSEVREAVKYCSCVNKHMNNTLIQSMNCLKPVNQSFTLQAITGMTIWIRPNLCTHVKIWWGQRQTIQSMFNWESLRHDFQHEIKMDMIYFPNMLKTGVIGNIWTLPEDRSLKKSINAFVSYCLSWFCSEIFVLSSEIFHTLLLFETEPRRHPE